jgi:3-mercaptopyruvate sulfurtransferase SseA
VALLLKKKGIQRVRPLHGGLEAWIEQRLPVQGGSENLVVIT